MCVEGGAWNLTRCDVYSAQGTCLECTVGGRVVMRACDVGGLGPGQDCARQAVEVILVCICMSMCMYVCVCVQMYVCRAWAGQRSLGRRGVCVCVCVCVCACVCVDGLVRTARARPSRNRPFPLARACPRSAFPLSSGSPSVSLARALHSHAPRPPSLPPHHHSLLFWSSVRKSREALASSLHPVASVAEPRPGKPHSGHARAKPSVSQTRPN